MRSNSGYASLLVAAVLFAMILPLPTNAFSQDTQEEFALEHGNSGLPYFLQDADAQKRSLEETLGFSIHGALSTRYRSRSTYDEHDQDLYQNLSLDLGDPRSDRVSAHIVARATADLDGDRDTTGYYPFDGTTDTFDKALNGRLYYAYVDVQRTLDLRLIRVGRQQIIESPEVMYFDGGRVETFEIRSLGYAQFGLYGGIPVHLYESSPDGDSVIGAYGQVSPWIGSQVRLDWSRIRDESWLSDVANNLYGIDVTQIVEKNTRLHSLYTRLDAEERDVRVDVIHTEPSLDLMVRGRYYQLIHAQNETLPVDIDPFLGILANMQPYHQIGFTIAKRFGQNIAIEAGGDTRDLRVEEDEGDFNREFQHYYLSPSVTDWPATGSRISLSGDVWDRRHTNNGDIRTMSGEVSQKFNSRADVAVGVSYALYKYDAFEAVEREDVTTHYVRGRYHWSKDYTWDLSYEIESDDYETYQTVKFGVSTKF